MYISFIFPALDYPLCPAFRYKPKSDRFIVLIRFAAALGLNDKVNLNFVRRSVQMEDTQVFATRARKRSAI